MHQGNHLQEYRNASGFPQVIQEVAGLPDIVLLFTDRRQGRSQCLSWQELHANLRTLVISKHSLVC